MRIAIPVVSGEVFSPLANAEAFHFYEDDHGKIVREFLEPMEESGTDAAVGLLERVGMAGIMLFPGYSGKADDAALRFLSGSVVSDPNNHCNACGFKGACSLKDKGGCGGN